LPFFKQLEDSAKFTQLNWHYRNLRRCTTSIA